MKIKLLFLLGLIYTFIMCLLLYTAKKRLNLYQINGATSLLMVVLIFSVSNDKGGEVNSLYKRTIYAVLFFLINLMVTRIVITKARNKEANLITINQSKLASIEIFNQKKHINNELNYYSV